MQKYDIAILTESRYDKPTVDTPYVRNLLLEDKLVKESLERQGLSVIRLDWATEGFDWSSVRFALFRTTWDYSMQFDKFKKWLANVEKKTQLINVPSIIRWNIDKHYLADLAKKGVNVPETVYISKGENATLAQLFEQTGWTEVVIKPTVSGGGRNTFRIKKEEIAAHEMNFQKIIAEEDMMMQPFLKNVMERGEISLMVMNGKYTHAVLKVAKKGDFRVQDDWGGTVHDYEPTPEEMAFAEAAVAACTPAPLYARIDVANDNDGNVTLIELELIEPELWFRVHPPAADVLAEGVVGWMKRF